MEENNNCTIAQICKKTLQDYKTGQTDGCCSFIRRSIK